MEYFDSGFTQAYLLHDGVKFGGSTLYHRYQTSMP